MDGIRTVRIIVQGSKVPLTVTLFDLDPHTLSMIHKVAGFIECADIEADLDD